MNVPLVGAAARALLEVVRAGRTVQTHCAVALSLVLEEKALGKVGVGRIRGGKCLGLEWSLVVESSEMHLLHDAGRMGRSKQQAQHRHQHFFSQSEHRKEKKAMSLTDHLTWENGLNLVLLGAIAVLLKRMFLPAEPPQPPAPPKKRELPQREFTLADLAQFDGNTPHADHDGEKPIYIAVLGNVYDVSAKAEFYGPGGPYACFAGHDASRGLAKMSFDVSSEWDDLKDLSAQEKQTVQDWEASYQAKYPCRGPLVKEYSKSPGSDDVN
eukprot:m.187080 g.187080  ORF g.187080 m.187080 type:complete len:269 (+) comp21615_c0_seq3:2472-3278(+)